MDQGPAQQPLPEAQHYEPQQQAPPQPQQARRAPPIKKFRAGGVSASVWENKDREGRVYHTVSFERGYKDQQGVWQSTSSLHVNDLPKGALVLQRAYEYLLFELPGGEN